MGIPDNYKVPVHPGRRNAAVLHDPDEPDEERQGRLHRDRRLVQEGHRGSARRSAKSIVAASSKDKNYTYVPDCSDLDIPDNTDYVYICENETIHGVTWNKLPNTKGHVLVSDQSSMFLSQPLQRL